MAQILVRNLDDRVKERLRQRAHAHKRSMEDEARVIIAEAVATPADRDTGWATRISQRFKACGLADEEIDKFELRGEDVRPAEFE